MGRYSNITIFFECGIVVYTLKNESRCSRILTNWLLLWIVCNLRNVVDAAAVVLWTLLEIGIDAAVKDL